MFDVQTLTKSVKIRMRDRLRYSVPLSGGLDSRAVLAAIDQNERNRIATFTFGLAGCDEIKVAQKVAKEAVVNQVQGKNELFSC